MLTAWRDKKRVVPTHRTEQMDQYVAHNIERVHEKAFSEKKEWAGFFLIKRTLNLQMHQYKLLPFFLIFLNIYSFCERLSLSYTHRKRMAVTNEGFPLLISSSFSCHLRLCSNYGRRLPCLNESGD